MIAHLTNVAGALVMVVNQCRKTTAVAKDVIAEIRDEGGHNDEDEQDGLLGLQETTAAGGPTSLAKVHPAPPEVKQEDSVGVAMAQSPQQQGGATEQEEHFQQQVRELREAKEHAVAEAAQLRRQLEAANGTIHELEAATAPVSAPSHASGVSRQGTQLVMDDMLER